MTTRRFRLRLICTRTMLACALVTGVASADLTPIERATAEALFQEGVQLMDQGDFSRACEKLAGTLELEPGLGTMLHLADCYDKLGRTSSSWALFEEVASRAKLGGDATRESIAAARANELKSRLSLVYLELKDLVGSSPTPSSLKVTLSGTLIPAAMWGSPIPMDPGQQQVKVTAEGYEPWSFSLVVAPGPSLRKVTVPLLKRVLPPKPATTAPTRPILASLSATPAYREPQNSTPRVLGYISGAIGLVGLGISGYFGYRAYQNQQSSLDSCRTSNPNLCTPDGVDRRDAAIRFADAANVSAIAGGACVLLGTTLLIVSPSTPEPSPPHDASSSDPTSAARLQGNAAFYPTSRSPTVSLRGVW